MFFLELYVPSFDDETKNVQIKVDRSTVQSEYGIIYFLENIIF